MPLEFEDEVIAKEMLTVNEIYRQTTEILNFGIPLNEYLTLDEYLNVVPELTDTEILEIVQRNTGTKSGDDLNQRFPNWGTCKFRLESVLRTHLSLILKVMME